MHIIKKGMNYTNNFGICTMIYTYKNYIMQLASRKKDISAILIMLPLLNKKSKDLKFNYHLSFIYK